MQKLGLVVVALAVVVAPALAAPKKQMPPPPIVQTVNVAPPPKLPEIPAERNTVHHGKWSSSDVGDHTVAYTENDSGSTFGILCGTSCVFYVNFHVDCTDREIYPAMINGPAGASSINLRCVHVKHNGGLHHVLATEAADAYFDMLKAGGEFGIAVPLASGKFNVSRFSLTGGLRAVATAVTAADERQKTAQHGLRDFTI